MLYKTWVKSKSSKFPKGDVRLYNKFSDHRRSLKHVITMAKCHYYGKKINEHQGNLKKTWSVINELRGKRKTVIKPQFIINNVRITNRRIIANKFNNYFVSLASNMNNAVDETGNIAIERLTTFTEFMSESIPGSIFLSDCTSEEIFQIISNLENGKSSDIPIRIIKRSSKLISPILERHFNHLMKVGEFPDELKSAKITPIYKKGNDELFENYRPVSTLPIFGKLFEKVMYERLYNFLISKKVLNTEQFGFRKGHSTSHALNYSVNYIENALNDKKHVIGIFIDLSKAFDTIDHAILLSKLEHYGIRGNAHRLLASYLTNRTQYTSVLNEKSGKASIRYGVPQGSILGPLLFLLYINDILNCSGLGKFVLFADDTNIFVKGENKSDTLKIANKVLDSMYRYMKSNKLHINYNKCCYMHFSPNRNHNNTVNSALESEEESLTINEIEIDEVVETKFLGVTIDNKLSWVPHINELTKKLKCNIGLLNRIKDFIPKSHHKTLYHTLFESHLTYGITVWGGVAENKLKSIFTAQKMCVRIMFGDKAAYLDKFKTCVRSRPYGSQMLGSKFYMKEHTKPLFNKYDILVAQHLYHYHTIINVFKILKNHTPVSLYSCFNFAKSQRKQLTLITPRHSRNFVHTASSLWNIFKTTAPLNQIRDFSVSTNWIKCQLKQWLFRLQKIGDAIEWDDENFILW